MAAASNWTWAALLPSDQERTTAAAAMRTWHTVSSGFFPPQLLLDLRQEQVTHGGYRLMAFQPQVGTSLEVVEAQFRLLILEAAFDVPTREGHQQEFIQPRVGRRVADEVLDLRRVQDVAGHDQMQWWARQIPFVLRHQPYVFHLPNQRSALRVLDPPLAPGLRFSAGVQFK